MLTSLWCVQNGGIWGWDCKAYIKLETFFLVEWTKQAVTFVRPSQSLVPPFEVKLVSTVLMDENYLNADPWFPKCKAALFKGYGPFSTCTLRLRQAAVCTLHSIDSVDGQQCSGTNRKMPIPQGWIICGLNFSFFILFFPDCNRKTHVFVLWWGGLGHYTEGLTMHVLGII